MVMRNGDVGELERQENVDCGTPEDGDAIGTVYRILEHSYNEAWRSYRAVGLDGHGN
jgi:hypothetical protein